VVLDPLNARALRAQGSIHYAARRYEEALTALSKALTLNPKLNFAHSLKGNSFMQLGRLPQAKAEFEAEPGDQFRLSGLAIVEQRLGNRAAAEKAFGQLVSEVGDSALYQQAQVLAQWGRSDEAIARLREARQVGDSGLIYLATDPLLDPLRSRPDFMAFFKNLADA
jgi:tetratricopeptide (TPR) repeat protein